MKILITGSSGFIGFHTAKKCLEAGHEVIGFDNNNDYYDVKHKIIRINILRNFSNFRFVEGDIATDTHLLTRCIKSSSHIIHLAAQAGVPYSYKNPQKFYKSNVMGFHTILELARIFKPENFVYASSSSVYGKSDASLFEEDDPLCATRSGFLYFC